MYSIQKAFGEFHTRITVNTGTRVVLKMAREAIRKRISRYFRRTLKVASPEFHSQGSFAVDTMVNPLDGEYGLDDGIYLRHLEKIDVSRWPDGNTVYQWLEQALADSGATGATGNNALIRFRHNGLYRIDLSAYAMDNDRNFLSAAQSADWRPSYPPSMAEWFRCHAELHGEQLVRIVRTVKAWADAQSLQFGPMPSGLILTVLAVRHYQSYPCDLASLATTLKAIANTVHPVFYVPNPVNITEDLTERMTQFEKTGFQEAVGYSADRAIHAMGLDDTETALQTWKRLLGYRFPACSIMRHFLTKTVSMTAGNPNVA
jgi:hypothetical protein